MPRLKGPGALATSRDPDRERSAANASTHRDRKVAAALIAWLGSNARDLPWRRTRDPYAVWVSEVMLQQTRVDTVVPYFERFLARFPTPLALAEAELDLVLEAWSGLGYYRRARALHAAAREVVDRFGGALPASASDLRSLSGVGPYTAGAIASLAFGLPEPLVDGNVARVLARLESVDQPIDQAPGRERVWRIARRMLPVASPGAFNEALMELGAMLCTPHAPRCDACPIAFACSARQRGTQADFPKTTKKRPVPEVPMVAAVLARGARVLLGQRRAEGLFGGLWEPPMVEASSLRAARTRLTELGVPRASDLRVNGRIAHVLTHKRLDVLVTSAALGAESELLEPSARQRRADATTRPSDAEPTRLGPPYDRFDFRDPKALGAGMSTLARKVLARAGLL